MSYIFDISKTDGNSAGMYPERTRTCTREPTRGRTGNKWCNAQGKARGMQDGRNQNSCGTHKRKHEDRTVFPPVFPLHLFCVFTCLLTCDAFPVLSPRAFSCPFPYALVVFPRWIWHALPSGPGEFSHAFLPTLPVRFLRFSVRSLRSHACFLALTVCSLSEFWWH